MKLIRLGGPRLKLRYKILILLLLLSIIPLVAVNVLWLNVAQSELEKTVTAEMSAATGRGADVAKAYFERKRISLIIHSQTNAMLQQDFASTVPELKNFITQDGDIKELTVLDKIGKERVKIARSREFLNTELRDRKQEAVFKVPTFVGGSIYLSPVAFEDSKPYIEVAIPIVPPGQTRNITDLNTSSTGEARAAGEILGVLIEKIDLSNLWGELQKLKISTNGYVFIVDQKGIVLMHSSDSKYVGKQLTNVGEVNEFVESRGNEERVATDFLQHNNEAGIASLMTFKTVPEAKWGVIGQVPLTDVSGITQKALSFAAALVLVTLAVVAFTGLTFTARIVKPLERLSQAVQRLGKGEKVEAVDIKSSGEIGELGLEFNKMTENLQASDSKLRARTDEAVNQQRTLKTLLDNLPVGVFVAKAPSGEPIMVNRVGVELLGRGVEPDARSETYSKIYDVIKEDGSTYPTEQLPLSITLSEGKPALKDDVLVRRPDGSIVALRIMSTPIRHSDGTFHTAVAVFEDISKERELERSREEFFSIASHELRTPLTAIRGNTDMIQQYYGEKLDDPDLKEMIKDIHESSIRLIGIVNDFLDTSRLEQKKMKFELAPFNIAELAEDVLKEYQVTGSRQKIHLEVTQPASPMPPVYGDRNRTKQILINLVGNALKFTTEGSITISFAVDKDCVKILVSDTGRGMSNDAQKLLFRKFEQTGATVLTRDSVQGTGLGLYISKMMIEQMHGHIQLESSTAGTGTVFSFTLPIASSTNGLLPDNPKKHTALA